MSSFKLFVRFPKIVSCVTFIENSKVFDILKFYFHVMGAAVLFIVGYSDFSLLRQKGISGHGNCMQNGIQRHLMSNCFRIEHSQRRQ